ncbi:Na-translocating system protein MpsC family protein [Marinococcus halotolerans]|uniref:Na-translocating system protein MpsC family protein n=1 Tax=Marinococcus halotolerans TaxID=301092 RepID=UPI0003B6098C|nr:Na-translocating system protein MpsC family protein [Marinococcus halotolerans]
MYLDNESRRSIAGKIGDIFKDNFGSGPSALQVTINGGYFFINIQNFLSPVEKELIGADKMEKVIKYRNIIMEERVRNEIKDIVETHADIQLKEIYYDWDLLNASGMLLGIMEQKGQKEGKLEIVKDKEVYNNLSQVNYWVTEENRNVQIYWLASHIILVKRENLLSGLEQELIQAGKDDDLSIVKRHCERKLIKEDAVSAKLNKQIKGIYFARNIKSNYGYMLVVLGEEKSQKFLQAVPEKSEVYWRF